MGMADSLRVMSWNVNGLRACAKKGFADWLEASGAWVVGTQETRARLDQLPEDIREPEGWHFNLSPAERGGYSGVGLYSRDAPDEVITSLDNPEFDVEGRVQLARFGRLWIANIYFPNGSGKNRDNSRIPYKLDFYRALYDRLEPMRAAGEPVLVMGDFNTAHEEIDLARPKSNHKTSGFCPEEREELSRWLQGGWEDTFRSRHPGAEGHYTWWSQRFGVRAKNIGWRIDYVYASPGAKDFVKDAFIHPDSQGSDHCPLGVDLDPAILR